MTEAVIVTTARTPLTKSWKGAFNMTHGATLGGHAIQHAVARAKLDPGEVEDVIMGCANPEGATGVNIARQSAIRAGLPVTTSGVTVNRFCSSGLQTIAMAAHRVIVDKVPVMVAGGVESASTAPLRTWRHSGIGYDRAPFAPAGRPDPEMGSAADDLARRRGYSRSRLDEWAARSHARTWSSVHRVSKNFRRLCW